MGQLLVRNVRLDGRAADLLIKGTRIEQVGLDLPAPPGAEILAGRGMEALPPLYNAHTHAAMTLMRGYADDMLLMPWLETKIWPLEKHMTADEVYLGARLACLEMIKTGTVFFHDMYWHWEATARAVEEMGLRAQLGAVFIDGGDAERSRLQRAATEAMVAACGRYSTRIRPALGPHAIYTVSRANLEWACALAREHALPLHIHMNETRHEVQECLRQHGVRPFEYLEAMGFLSGPTPVMAAHCVHLSDAEIEIMARRGVCALHIPVANMKLAVGGVLPYGRLRRAGVRVLLGTDGCSSNNGLDLFDTMKFAALLQKHDREDPTALPAGEVWAAATGEAAQAFATGGGQLAPGRPADLILVRTRSPEFTPGYHLHSDLVYAANGSCVDTMICAGRILMKGRRVPDEEAILDDSRAAVTALLRRAGLSG